MIDFHKHIKDGVISAYDLKRLLGSGARNIRLLDATYGLPADSSFYEGYLRGRIGQAAFFGIDEIADKTSPLPHMLPKPNDFEAAVSKLGISNSDFVVIYSQHGMVMGPPRAWWMFRAFDHDGVCVLDGGMPLWVAAGYDVETNSPSGYPRGRFKAGYRPELVKTMKEVEAAQKSGASNILDARPSARFAGAAPEPRPNLRLGHIPGSANAPAAAFAATPTGVMKSDSEITAIFEKAGYDSQKPVITTCGSGVTACMIALALHKMGHTDAAVYDGSWAEWGQPDSQMPVSPA